MVIKELNDITNPDTVEITVRKDRKVLWINVDGLCVLRICSMKGPINLVLDKEFVEFAEDLTNV